MKITHLSMMIFFSSFSLTVFAKSAIHENKITFVHPQETNGTAADLFLVDRHSVTADQPADIKDQTLLPHWFRPYRHCHAAKTTFWIMAGRHKSQAVAEDIKQWGYNTTGTPTEMNFAVEGSLRFTLSSNHTYVCKNIVLAQTGQGLSNPWYIFSLDGSGTYQGTRYTDMTCINTSSKALREFRIVPREDRLNVFEIRPESPEIK